METENEAICFTDRWERTFSIDSFDDESVGGSTGGHGRNVIIRKEHPVRTVNREDVGHRRQCSFQLHYKEVADNDGETVYVDRLEQTLALEYEVLSSTSISAENISENTDDITFSCNFSSDNPHRLHVSEDLAHFASKIKEAVGAEKNDNESDKGNMVEENVPDQDLGETLALPCTERWERTEVNDDFPVCNKIKTFQLFHPWKSLVIEPLSTVLIASNKIVEGFDDDDEINEKTERIDNETVIPEVNWSTNVPFHANKNKEFQLSYQNVNITEEDTKAVDGCYENTNCPQDFQLERREYISARDLINVEIAGTSESSSLSDLDNIQSALETTHMSNLDLVAVVAPFTERWERTEHGQGFSCNRFIVSQGNHPWETAQNHNSIFSIQNHDTNILKEIHNERLHIAADNNGIMPTNDKAIITHDDDKGKQKTFVSSRHLETRKIIEVESNDFSEVEVRHTSYLNITIGSESTKKDHLLASELNTAVLKTTDTDIIMEQKKNEIYWTSELHVNLPLFMSKEETIDYSSDDISSNINVECDSHESYVAFEDSMYANDPNDFCSEDSVKHMNLNTLMNNGSNSDLLKIFSNKEILFTAEGEKTKFVIENVNEGDDTKYFVQNDSEYSHSTDNTELTVTHASDDIECMMENYIVDARKSDDTEIVSKHESGNAECAMEKGIEDSRKDYTQQLVKHEDTGYVMENDIEDSRKDDTQQLVKHEDIGYVMENDIEDSRKDDTQQLVKHEYTGYVMENDIEDSRKDYTQQLVKHEDIGYVMENDIEDSRKDYTQQLVKHEDIGYVMENDIEDSRKDDTQHLVKHEDTGYVMKNDIEDSRKDDTQQLVKHEDTGYVMENDIEDSRKDDTQQLVKHEDIGYVMENDIEDSKSDDTQQLVKHKDAKNVVENDIEGSSNNDSELIRQCPENTEYVIENDIEDLSNDDSELINQCPENSEYVVENDIEDSSKDDTQQLVKHEDTKYVMENDIEDSRSDDSELFNQCPENAEYVMQSESEDSGKGTVTETVIKQEDEKTESAIENDNEGDATEYFVKNDSEYFSTENTELVVTHRSDDIEHMIEKYIVDARKGDDIEIVNKHESGNAERVMENGNGDSRKDDTQQQVKQEVADTEYVMENDIEDSRNDDSEFFNQCPENAEYVMESESKESRRGTVTGTVIKQEDDTNECVMKSMSGDSGDGYIEIIKLDDENSDFIMKHDSDNSKRDGDRTLVLKQVEEYTVSVLKDDSEDFKNINDDTELVVKQRGKNTQYVMENDGEDSARDSDTKLVFAAEGEKTESFIENDNEGDATEYFMKNDSEYFSTENTELVVTHKSDDIEHMIEKYIADARKSNDIEIVNKHESGNAERVMENGNGDSIQYDPELSKQCHENAEYVMESESEDSGKDTVTETAIKQEDEKTESAIENDNEGDATEYFVKNDSEYFSTENTELVVTHRSDDIEHMIEKYIVDARKGDDIEIVNKHESGNAECAMENGNGDSRKDDTQQQVKQEVADTEYVMENDIEDSRKDYTQQLVKHEDIGYVMKNDIEDSRKDYTQQLVKHEDIGYVMENDIEDSKSDDTQQLVKHKDAKNVVENDIEGSSNNDSELIRQCPENTEYVMENDIEDSSNDDSELINQCPENSEYVVENDIEDSSKDDTQQLVKHEDTKYVMENDIEDSRSDDSELFNQCPENAEYVMQSESEDSGKGTVTETVIKQEDEKTESAIENDNEGDATEYFVKNDSEYFSTENTELVVTHRSDDIEHMIEKYIVDARKGDDIEIVNKHESGNAERVMENGNGDSRKDDTQQQVKQEVADTEYVMENDIEDSRNDDSEFFNQCPENAEYVMESESKESRRGTVTGTVIKQEDDTNECVMKSMSGDSGDGYIEIIKLDDENSDFIMKHDSDNSKRDGDRTLVLKQVEEYTVSVLKDDSEDFKNINDDTELVVKQRGKNTQYVMENDGEDSARDSDTKLVFAAEGEKTESFIENDNEGDATEYFMKNDSEYFSTENTELVVTHKSDDIEHMIEKYIADARKSNDIEIVNKHESGNAERVMENGNGDSIQYDPELSKQCHENAEYVMESESEDSGKDTVTETAIKQEDEKTESAIENDNEGDATEYFVKNDSEYFSTENTELVVTHRSDDIEHMIEKYIVDARKGDDIEIVNKHESGNAECAMENGNGDSRKDDTQQQVKQEVADTEYVMENDIEDSRKDYTQQLVKHEDIGYVMKNDIEDSRKDYTQQLVKHEDIGYVMENDIEDSKSDDTQQLVKHKDAKNVVENDIEGSSNNDSELIRQCPENTEYVMENDIEDSSNDDSELINQCPENSEYVVENDIEDSSKDDTQQLVKHEDTKYVMENDIEDSRSDDSELFNQCPENAEYVMQSESEDSGKGTVTETVIKQEDEKTESAIENDNEGDATEYFVKNDSEYFSTENTELVVTHRSDDIEHMIEKYIVDARKGDDIEIVNKHESGNAERVMENGNGDSRKDDTQQQVKQEVADTEYVMENDIEDSRNDDSEFFNQCPENAEYVMESESKESRRGTVTGTVIKQEDDTNECVMKSMSGDSGDGYIEIIKLDDENSDFIMKHDSDNSKRDGDRTLVLKQVEEYTVSVLKDDSEDFKNINDDTELVVKQRGKNTQYVMENDGEDSARDSDTKLVFAAEGEKTESFIENDNEGDATEYFMKNDSEYFSTENTELVVTHRGDDIEHMIEKYIADARKSNDIEIVNKHESGNAERVMENGNGDSIQYDPELSKQCHENAEYVMESESEDSGKGTVTETVIKQEDEKTESAIENDNEGDATEYFVKNDSEYFSTENTELVVTHRSDDIEHMIEKYIVDARKGDDIEIVNKHESGNAECAMENGNGDSRKDDTQQQVKQEVADTEYVMENDIEDSRKDYTQQLVKHEDIGYVIKNDIEDSRKDYTQQLVKHEDTGYVMENDIEDSRKDDTQQLVKHEDIGYVMENDIEDSRKDDTQQQVKQEVADTEYVMENDIEDSRNDDSEFFNQCPENAEYVMESESKESRRGTVTETVIKQEDDTNECVMKSMSGDSGDGYIEIIKLDDENSDFIMKHDSDNSNRDGDRTLVLKQVEEYTVSALKDDSEDFKNINDDTELVVKQRGKNTQYVMENDCEDSARDSDTKLVFAAEGEKTESFIENDNEGDATKYFVKNDSEYFSTENTELVVTHRDDDIEHMIEKYIADARKSNDIEIVNKHESGNAERVMKNGNGDSIQYVPELSKECHENAEYVMESESEDSGKGTVTETVIKQEDEKTESAIENDNEGDATEYFVKNDSEYFSTENTELVVTHRSDDIEHMIEKYIVDARKGDDIEIVNKHESGNAECAMENGNGDSRKDDTQQQVKQEVADTEYVMENDIEDSRKDYTQQLVKHEDIGYVMKNDIEDSRKDYTQQLVKHEDTGYVMENDIEDSKKDDTQQLVKHEDIGYVMENDIEDSRKDDTQQQVKQEVADTEYVMENDIEDSRNDDSEFFNQCPENAEYVMESESKESRRGTVTETVIKQEDDTNECVMKSMSGDSGDGYIEIIKLDDENSDFIMKHDSDNSKRDGDRTLVLKQVEKYTVSVLKDDSEDFKNINDDTELVVKQRGKNTQYVMENDCEDSARDSDTKLVFAAEGEKTESVIENDNEGDTTKYFVKNDSKYFITENTELVVTHRGDDIEHMIEKYIADARKSNDIEIVNKHESGNAERVMENGNGDSIQYDPELSKQCHENAEYVMESESEDSGKGTVTETVIKQEDDTNECVMKSKIGDYDTEIIKLEDKYSEFIMKHESDYSKTDGNTTFVLKKGRKNTESILTVDSEDSKSRNDDTELVVKQKSKNTQYVMEYNSEDSARDSDSNLSFSVENGNTESVIENDSESHTAEYIVKNDSQYSSRDDTNLVVKQVVSDIKYVMDNYRQEYKKDDADIGDSRREDEAEYVTMSAFEDCKCVMENYHEDSRKEHTQQFVKQQVEDTDYVIENKSENSRRHGTEIEVMQKSEDTDYIIKNINDGSKTDDVLTLLVKQRCEGSNNIENYSDDFTTDNDPEPVVNKSSENEFFCENARRDDDDSKYGINPGGEDTEYVTQDEIELSEIDDTNHLGMQKREDAEHIIKVSRDDLKTNVNTENTEHHVSQNEKGTYDTEERKYKEDKDKNESFHRNDNLMQGFILDDTEVKDVQQMYYTNNFEKQIFQKSSSCMVEQSTTLRANYISMGNLQKEREQAIDRSELFVHAEKHESSLHHFQQLTEMHRKQEVLGSTKSSETSCNMHSIVAPIDFTLKHGCISSGTTVNDSNSIDFTEKVLGRTKCGSQNFTDTLYNTLPLPHNTSSTGCPIQMGSLEQKIISKTHDFKQTKNTSGDPVPLTKFSKNISVKLTDVSKLNVSEMMDITSTPGNVVSSQIETYSQVNNVTMVDTIIPFHTGKQRNIYQKENVSIVSCDESALKDAFSKKNFEIVENETNDKNNVNNMQSLVIAESIDQLSEDKFGGQVGIRNSYIVNKQYCNQTVNSETVNWHFNNEVMNFDILQSANTITEAEDISGSHFHDTSCAEHEDTPRVTSGDLFSDLHMKSQVSSCIFDNTQSDLLPQIHAIVKPKITPPDLKAVLQKQEQYQRIVRHLTAKMEKINIVLVHSLEVSLDTGIREYQEIQPEIRALNDDISHLKVVAAQLLDVLDSPNLEAHNAVEATLTMLINRHKDLEVMVMNSRRQLQFEDSTILNAKRNQYFQSESATLRMQTSSEATCQMELTPVLSQRWENLQQDWRLSENKYDLVRFANEIENILTWLSEAEALQSLHQSLPPDIAQLDIIIRQFQDFKIQLESKKISVVSVNSLSKKFLETKTTECMQLQEKLNELNSRWQLVLSRTTQLERNLQVSLIQCQEFYHRIHDYQLWLEDLETRIHTCQLVNLNTDASVRNKYFKLLELSDELQRRQPQLMSLRDTADHVLMNVESAEVLSARSQAHLLDSHMHTLMRLISAYSCDLEKSLQISSNRTGERYLSESQHLENSPSLRSRDESISAPSWHAFSEAMPLAFDSRIQEKDNLNREPETAETASQSSKHTVSAALLMRVIHAALPVYFLFLLLFLLLYLLPVCEDEYECMFDNSLQRSISPMLRYTHGAPPT
ncbi:hypothetical protein BsWGS_11061 [Bradybaena similaris]